MNTYRAKRWDSGDVVTVGVEDGRISLVESSSEKNEINVDLPIIAPGLFDIQVNGAVGVEFSSSELTEDGVCAVLEKTLKDGVFRICPTLTTNAPETMISAASTIVNALEKHREFAPIVWGIHLEGPFISSAEGAIGAHPKRYCSTYSVELFDKIYEASRGLVKLITLTPEYPNCREFISYLRSLGIVVSIGHTNATGSQIYDAITSGATLSTHLSNATRHLLPKWENYFFAQLADDRLNASIIVDGFHISPQLVRTIVRAKGLDRLILISDQSPLAGFPPGKYSMELCDFEIQPNGKVTLAGDPNLLACASFPVSNAVVNVATIAELPLSSVYPLATTNPARLLGAPKWSSGNEDFLETGVIADFILFEVKSAEMGERGVLDGSSFRTGTFDFKNIVWRGRKIV